MPSDDPCPAVLPEHEELLFVMVRREAQDLACAGRTLDGYQRLLSARTRAGELQRGGTAWAGRLLALLDQALLEYGELHGARPD